jgi:hypothetical protein
MPETFLILLAAGVMLAAAVPEPRDVTLRWLRLAGMIALVMVGLSVFFWWRREEARAHVVALLYGVIAVLVLGQLATTQLARAKWARLLAAMAFVVGVVLGVHLGEPAAGAEARSIVALIISCAGVAAMTGLALMDMLIGHAYLTAANMTMRPFRRLNNALAVVLAGRGVAAVGGVLWLNARSPVYMLWGAYGVYILTRWVVGLVVPAVFVYMTGDCINRRATQSATGILYVAGVLIFIGEILAMHLVRETGLPF